MKTNTKKRLYIVLLVISILINSSIIYAGVVGRIPEVASFTANPGANVNLFTGGMTLGIPIMTVPGRASGMSYPISLSYSAGVMVGQEATWVGLGWNIAPGSIVRGVNGIPDDYDTSSSESGIISASGMDEASLASVSASPEANPFERISYGGQGGVFTTITKYEEGNSPTPSSGDSSKRASEELLSGEPGDLGSVAVVALDSITGNVIYAKKQTEITGFLYTNKGHGEEEDRFDPDTYAAHGPISGRLLLTGDYNKREFHMKDSSGNLSTDHDDPLKIEYKKDDRGFISSFTITDKDGTKYVYGFPLYEVSSTGGDAPEPPEASGVLEDIINEKNNPLDYVVRSDTLVFGGGQSTTLYLKKYAYAWLLTEILSPDYEDISDDGPSDDDRGNWVKLKYEPDYYGNPNEGKPGPFQYREPFGKPGEESLIDGDYKEHQRPFSSPLTEVKTVYSAKSGYMEVAHLSSVETPTHKAVFEVSDRLDAAEYDPDDLWGLLEQDLNCQEQDDVISSRLSRGPTSYGTDLTPVARISRKSFTFQFYSAYGMDAKQVQVEYWFGSGLHSTETMDGLSLYKLTINIDPSQESTLHYMYHIQLAADGNWVEIAQRDVLTCPPEATTEVYDQKYVGNKFLKKLDSITLYGGVNKNKRVSEIVFNYDYSLNLGIPNSKIGKLSFDEVSAVKQDDSSTYPPAVHGLVNDYARGIGRLTLKSIQTFGESESDVNPQTVFEYGNNPEWLGVPENPKLTTDYRFDSFGYYWEDGTANNHMIADRTFVNNEFLRKLPKGTLGRNELSDISKADAWSLTKVIWPSGSINQWEYERGSYVIVGNQKTTALDERNSVGIGSTQTVSGVCAHYGGIRVKKQIIKEDERDPNPMTINYFYKNALDLTHDEPSTWENIGAGAPVYDDCLETSDSSGMLAYPTWGVNSVNNPQVLQYAQVIETISECPMVSIGEVPVIGYLSLDPPYCSSNSDDRDDHCNTVCLNNNAVSGSCSGKYVEYEKKYSCRVRERVDACGQLNQGDPCSYMGYDGTIVSGCNDVNPGEIYYLCRFNTTCGDTPVDRYTGKPICPGDSEHGSTEDCDEIIGYCCNECSCSYLITEYVPDCPKGHIIHKFTTSKNHPPERIDYKTGDTTKSYDWKDSLNRETGNFMDTSPLWGLEYETSVYNKDRDLIANKTRIFDTENARQKYGSYIDRCASTGGGVGQCWTPSGEYRAEKVSPYWITLKEETDMLDGVDKKREYVYNAENGLIKEIIEHGNDKKRISTTDYAFEQSTWFGSAYEKMKDNHMLSQVYMSSIYEDSIVKKNLKSQTKTTYRDFDFGPGIKLYPATTEVWESTYDNWLVTEYKDYDDYGNLLHSVDPKGYNTWIKYAYDYKYAYPTLETNQLGHKTKASYNFKFGTVSSITDVDNGDTTYYGYDGFGRLTDVTKPYDTEPSINYYYDPKLHWIKTTSKIDELHTKEVTQYFDNLVRPYATVLENGANDILTLTIYDNSIGKVLKEYKPYYETIGPSVFTEYTYSNDTLLRTTIVNPPGEGNIVSSYGNEENNFNIVSVTDEEGRTTKSFSDKFGNLVKIHDAIEHDTHYKYDILGNVITLTNAIGQESSMKYNSLGWLTEKTEPDTGNQRFIYDDNGNLKKEIDASGAEIDYVYDKLNRLIIIDYPESQDVSKTYDKCKNGIGRLCTAGDISGFLSFNYDDRGRITDTSKVVGDKTYVIGYEYTIGDNIKNVTHPNNKNVSYHYNNVGLLENVKEGPNNIASFIYNPTLTINTINYGNNIVTNFEYTDRDWMENINSNVFNRDYFYDKVGNLDYEKRGDILLADYSYDELDRLTDAVYTNIPNILDTHYTYDAIGNRLTKTYGLETYSYGYKDGTNQLTDDGINTYRYDDKGNMILKNEEINYNYDEENRLKCVGDDYYVYDSEGKRVKKVSKDETTIYIYDINGKPIFEEHRALTWEEQTARTECTIAAAERPAVIECYSDSDCDSNEWVGNPLCYRGDEAGNAEVHQVFRSYKCNNPGTISSSCSYSDKIEKKEDCSYYCNAGACTRCLEASHCGTDGWIDGTEQCSIIGGSDIIQKNYRTYTCSNEGTPDARCKSIYQTKEFKNCLKGGCKQEGASFSCEPECTIINEDIACAPDEFVGARWCGADGNVHQNYQNNYCIVDNAEPLNNYCSFSIIDSAAADTLVDECLSSEACDGTTVVTTTASCGTVAGVAQCVYTPTTEDCTINNNWVAGTESCYDNYGVKQKVSVYQTYKSWACEEDASGTSCTGSDDVRKRIDCYGQNKVCSDLSGKGICVTCNQDSDCEGKVTKTHYNTYCEAKVDGTTPIYSENVVCKNKGLTTSYCTTEKGPTGQVCSSTERCVDDPTPDPQSPPAECQSYADYCRTLNINGDICADNEKCPNDAWEDRTINCCGTACVLKTCSDRGGTDCSSPNMCRSGSSQISPVALPGGGAFCCSGSNSCVRCNVNSDCPADTSATPASKCLGNDIWNHVRDWSCSNNHCVYNDVYGSSHSPPSYNIQTCIAGTEICVDGFAWGAECQACSDLGGYTCTANYKCTAGYWKEGLTGCCPTGCVLKDCEASKPEGLGGTKCSSPKKCVIGSTRINIDSTNFCCSGINSCIECESNSDCASTQYCKNGVCKDKELRRTCIKYIQAGQSECDIIEDNFINDITQSCSDGTTTGNIVSPCKKNALGNGLEYGCLHTTYCSVTAPSCPSGWESRTTDSCEAVGDITAPVITVSAPSYNEILSIGTTSANVQIATNENANCKYSSSDFDYSIQGSLFATTGAKIHSFIYSGLSDGNTYNLYYRCKDSNNNINPAPATHSFSIASCTPNTCTDLGKDCGLWPDGCDGTLSCGSCTSPGVCNNGVCCTPNCADKTCGSDGCGGTCGSCAARQACYNNNCCTPICTGRECGSNGCGGSCGSCDRGEVCSNGQCITPQMR